MMELATENQQMTKVLTTQEVAARFNELLSKKNGLKYKTNFSRKM